MPGDGIGQSAPPKGQLAAAAAADMRYSQESAFQSSSNICTLCVGIFLFSLSSEFACLVFLRRLSFGFLGFFVVRSVWNLCNR